MPHHQIGERHAVHVVKTQDVGVSGFGGDGHGVGVAADNGEVFHIGDNQLIAVIAALPMVIGAVAAGIARRFGQVILAGGQDDFRIGGDGIQKFIHGENFDPGLFRCGFLCGGHTAQPKSRQQAQHQEDAFFENRVFHNFHPFRLFDSANTIAQAVFSVNEHGNILQES